MSKSRKNCELSESELEEILSEMKLLCKKWSIQIIRSLLRNETLYFKQLRAQSNGVSNKILAERLEQLQDGGIITKEDDEYTLTSKGRALEEVFESVLEWKQKHEG